MRQHIQTSARSASVILRTSEFRYSAAALLAIVCREHNWDTFSGFSSGRRVVAPAPRSRLPAAGIASYRATARLYGAFPGG